MYAYIYVLEYIYDIWPSIVLWMGWPPIGWCTWGESGRPQNHTMSVLSSDWFTGWTFGDSVGEAGS